MNDKIKGFLAGTVAAVTYGMNPLFALPLYQEKISTDSVLFYRYAFGLLLLGSIMKIRGKSLRISKKEIMPLFIAGILVALSSLLLFLSFLRMEAGIASTILFVYPVMVAVIMAVFFREKITSITVWSIVCALAGIAFLYKGGEGGTLSFVGVIMVILSALAYAIYIIGVKHSRLKALSGELLTFYVLLFGLSVFWVRLKFGLDLQMLSTWTAWSNVWALALVTTVVSLLCTALAVRYVGATTTAILGALEPVTAVFFGVTVFGEKLTFRVCSGIALIIFAVALIIVGKPVIAKFKEIFK